MGVFAYNDLFWSNRLRTLIAMVTFFHRLIMVTFFLSQWRFLLTEMFIEHSSVFHMNFVQIAEFDWLPGRHKA